MRTIYSILLIILLCGCSSVQKHKAVRDAVEDDLISGVSPSDQFETMPWSFPSKNMGPYSDIDGFSGTITNDPSQHQCYIFFVGKLRTTKEWEVFSAMTWTNGAWATVPVKRRESEEEKYRAQPSVPGYRHEGVPQPDPGRVK